MPKWLTELSHLPPEDQADVPPVARERAAFTRAVVEAATSRAVTSEPWGTAVRCIERAGPKSCSGRATVVRDRARSAIEWACPTCGVDGVIRGIVDSAHDLSAHVPRGKTVPWGMDDEEREVLWEATRWTPSLRAVIARASPHPEMPELLMLFATVSELDEVYTMVEELTDGTRSRRRRELLDGLRASLSTSIDGF